MTRYLEQDNNDFYIENGLVVFTKKHHLKRGYCCKNNCKNCPYKKNNAAFVPPELRTVSPYGAKGFMPSKKAED